MPVAARASLSAMTALDVGHTTCAIPGEAQLKIQGRACLLERMSLFGDFGLDLDGERRVGCGVIELLEVVVDHIKVLSQLNHLGVAHE